MREVETIPSLKVPKSNSQCFAHFPKINRITSKRDECVEGNPFGKSTIATFNAPPSGS